MTQDLPKYFTSMGLPNFSWEILALQMEVQQQPTEAQVIRLLQLYTVVEGISPVLQAGLQKRLKNLMTKPEVYVLFARSDKDRRLARMLTVEAKLARGRSEWDSEYNRAMVESKASLRKHQLQIRKDINSQKSVVQQKLKARKTRMRSTTSQPGNKQNESFQ